MTDAASPDTPTGPRGTAIRRALDVAGAAAEQAGLRGEFLILAIAIPALADAGLLSLSGDSTQGEGSLRSGASGTPAETIAEALRDVRLDLTPHALEAIHGGANHLILTDTERGDIGLIAAKALGLKEVPRP